MDKHSVERYRGNSAYRFLCLSVHALDQEHKSIFSAEGDFDCVCVYLFSISFADEHYSMAGI